MVNKDVYIYNNLKTVLFLQSYPPKTSGTSSE